MDRPRDTTTKDKPRGRTSNAVLPSKVTTSSLSRSRVSPSGHSEKPLASVSRQELPVSVASSSRPVVQGTFEARSRSNSLSLKRFTDPKGTDSERLPPLLRRNSSLASGSIGDDGRGSSLKQTATRAPSPPKGAPVSPRVASRRQSTSLPEGSRTLHGLQESSTYNRSTDAYRELPKELTSLSLMEPIHGSKDVSPSPQIRHPSTTALAPLHRQPVPISPPKDAISHFSVPSSPKLKCTSSLSSGEDLKRTKPSTILGGTLTPPVTSPSSTSSPSPSSIPSRPSPQASRTMTVVSPPGVDTRHSTQPEWLACATVAPTRAKHNALCGLKNLGNTCYMNAIIQVLRHTYELSDSVLRLCAGVKLKPDGLLKNYSDLVKDMQDPGAQGPASLKPFKAAFDRKCPRFGGYDQQDATEFMRLLISEMHEEWKSINPQLPPPSIPPQALVLRDHRDAEAAWKQLLVAEKTDIAALFMGMYRSAIKCQTCSNESVKYEPFWDLSVPCPQQADSSSVVSLEACIDLFTREETLDGDNKPTCDKCGTRTTSVKQLTLQKMPHVMAIVLKRFAHTRYGTISKVETTISVPFTIDMSKYLSKNAGITKTQFNLFAVANHMGTNRFGHYTAWCKNDFEWNLFNDSTVTKSPPSGSPSIKSKDAYALFYRFEDPYVV